MAVSASTMKVHLSCHMVHYLILNNYATCLIGHVLLGFIEDPQNVTGLPPGVMAEV